MKKYEYMTVDLRAEPAVNVHIKLERKKEKLNEYGKQGWRLISGTDDWKYSFLSVKLMMKITCRRRITYERYDRILWADCEKCDAYLATINNDQALREKQRSLWAELNNATIMPEHINCEGCRMNGAKTVFCDSLCEIRKCALEKAFPPAATALR